MKMDLTPDAYQKLLSNKVSMLTAYPYIHARKNLEKREFYNIHQIYLDGQELYLKKELARYDFSDRKNRDMISLIKKEGEKLIEVSKAVKSRSNSKENLIGEFETFYSEWSSFIGICDIPIYCAMNYEERVRREFRNEGFDDEEVDIITQSQILTFHQKRDRDIIKVKHGNMTRKEFIKKWCWSEMDLFHYHEIDDEFIDSQISHTKEESIKEFEKQKKVYNNIYSRLNDELRRKADLIQDFIHIRDYRFECLLRANYSVYPLLVQISEELRVDYEELIYMLPEEITNRNIPPDLSERKEGYALKDDKVYTGTELKKLKKVFLQTDDLNELKGKVISKGNVKGNAKVVLSSKELGKIEDGDILICEMTTPDYVSGMKKVAGIVTELGGFTCHAAIVAREFGTPCIVSVANATNVFKDGDMIELDTDSGIVRKIS